MNTIEFAEMVVKTINERYHDSYKAEGDKIVPPINYIGSEMRYIADICDEYGVYYSISTEVTTRKMYIRFSRYMDMEEIKTYEELRDLVKILYGGFATITEETDEEGRRFVIVTKAVCMGLGELFDIKARAPYICAMIENDRICEIRLKLWLV